MSQATLSTERLTLRPLRMSDIGPIQLYASEERLARMTTSIPHPLPPGAAESFVEKSMAERGAETVWAITPKNGLRDELVGLISVEQNGPLNAGELGYWVGEPFREVGYATEAVVALVGHLVELGMDLVEHGEATQVIIICLAMAIIISEVES